MRYFPCRTHRRLTSSRPRFPPHLGRFHDSDTYFALRHLPPLHWLMQTLHWPVTMTTRQPPTPVPLCFADFASKLAWYAPFQILPYLRPAFHVVRQKLFTSYDKKILWGSIGGEQAIERIWNYTFCLYLQHGRHAAIGTPQGVATRRRLRPLSEANRTSLVLQRR